jgi:hypothetical protein
MGMLDFQSFWNFGEMNSLQETGRNHAKSMWVAWFEPADAVKIKMETSPI